jgi:biopolymer transport protein TolR
MPMDARIRSLIRRKAKATDHDPSEEGEINLVAYLDIVTNIIMFLLITVTTVMATVDINVSSPRLGGGGGAGDEPQPNELNLTITVTSSGFIVAGSGGVLTQGCDRTGPPPTVPRTGPEWDYDGLTRCVQRIKTEFPNETRAIVAANPEIKYEIVVRTMDAIRGAPPSLLFTDIMMSAGIQ